MKFAGIPCCCCPCNFNAAEMNLTLVSGSLSGSDTASNTGQFTLSNDCLAGRGRHLQGGFRQFTFGSFVGANGFLKVTNHGDGSDDLIFLMRRSLPIQIFFGATELGIPGGISASYFNSSSSGPGQPLRPSSYECCFSDPDEAGNVWAWFGPKLGGVRVQDIPFVPGDTITVDWDLDGGTGPVQGVAAVSAKVQRDGCDDLCGYSAFEDTLFYFGSPSPPWEIRTANYPRRIDITFDGFRNGTCASWASNLNDTWGMSWQATHTSGPYAGYRSHHQGFPTLSTPPCVNVFFPDSLSLDAFFEYYSGVYRFRLEWKYYGTSTPGGTPVATMTAIYEFGATKPLLEEWEEFDMTITASSFTGIGDIDPGNYLIRVNAA